MRLFFHSGFIFLCSFVINASCLCQIYTEESPCIGRPQLSTWYSYDVSKNTCVNVTYKGCGGVGNLFDSKDECHNSCIYNISSVCTARHVSSSDMCRRLNAYKYDSNANECATVFADTCVWNGSSLFMTKEACTRTCGINGGWTAWSFWGSCVPVCRTNGYRYRSRYRDCVSPEPKYGGQPCKGPNVEFQECYSCVADTPIVTYESKMLALNSNKTRDEISYFQSRINIDGNKQIIIRDKIVISAPENFVLLINLKDMNIRGNENHNFVKIYEGSGVEKSELKRYTTSGDSSLISTSRIVEINVQQTETTWFNASITMIPSDCKEEFGDHIGEIRLPGVNGDLPFNFDCEYIIHTEEEGYLFLHLHELYLVDGDYVKIYGNYPEEKSLTFTLPEDDDDSRGNLTLSLYGNVFRIHIHTGFAQQSKLSSINYEVIKPKKATECVNVSDYDGLMNVTSSGSLCLPWRNYLGKESSINFPNNFCRVYNSSSSLVCYSDTSGKLETCNITQCAVEKLVKPVGVGDKNDNSEASDKSISSEGAAENQTILLAIAGAAMLSLLGAVFGLLIKNRLKKNRPVDTLQVVAGRNSVSSIRAVNLNIKEGTAAYCVARDSRNVRKSNIRKSNVRKSIVRKSDSISERKRGTYEYAEVSNSNNEEEDDYACVENMQFTSENEAYDAEKDNVIDTDYAILSDESKRSSDKSECKYVEVGDSEYDFLRGSREIISSNERNEHVYGDDIEIYVESHRESASANFDKSDYGVGIPLNIKMDHIPRD